MSKNIPKLSLEAEDGLLLPVAEIHAAQTEEREHELSGLQNAIAEKIKQLSHNENRIKRYENILADIPRFDISSFETIERRNAFTQTIIVANPEFADLEPDILFTETGAEYVKFLLNFICEVKNNTERETEIIRTEIATLERDAGILTQNIQSQKALAQEKIRIQKERVRASASFIEATGASALVQKLQPVFARISEATPVSLPSGDIITVFHPARMEFT